MPKPLDIASVLAEMRAIAVVHNEPHDVVG